MIRHGITTNPARDTLPEATLPCAPNTMTAADQVIRRHMFPRHRSSQTRRNGRAAIGTVRKMSIRVSYGMGSKSKSP